MEQKSGCSSARSGRSGRSSCRLAPKDRVDSNIPRLKSSFADTERARWKKLSSTKAFTASSPPYLSATVDPKLLEAANLHCTNKASMLRMQHRSQNTIQPNADIHRTIKQNRTFELKSKILTASIILSSEPELSHGFLLGSRYNSIRTIDTNPLKIGGMCVPRNNKSNCFMSALNSHNVRRDSSAPRTRTPTSKKPKEIPSQMIYNEPLSICGISFNGEDQRTYSAAGLEQPVPSLPSPPPNSTVSESTASDSVNTSREYCPTSGNESWATVKAEAVESPQNSPGHRKETSSKEEDSDKDNFWDENENDLLSPEAQKLTSQILMSFSKTSLGSRTISQVSVTPQGSVVENADNHSDISNILDDGVSGNIAPGLTREDDPGDFRDTKTESFVVDMSHLMAGSELTES